MNETTRQFPRDTRSAFRIWPENALGINGPIPTRPTLWQRVLRIFGAAS